MYLQTSALTGENIEQTFHTLVKGKIVIIQEVAKKHLFKDKISKRSSQTTTATTR